MELTTGIDPKSASQSFDICGGTLYTAKDAYYFAMIKCTATGNLFKTYDYIFVEDLIKRDVFAAKIHSIYMERKSHSLCMEVQYFPILPQDQDPEAEPMVSEATQTLELLQIDTAVYYIKPATMMYLPPTIEDKDVYEYVCNHVQGYKEEHTESADMETGSDESCYEGSFIASEGTCTVYDNSTCSKMSEASSKKVQVQGERQGERECEREVTMYFYYNKLDLNGGGDLEKPDLVPAIEPVLLDLLWSYNCDVLDVSGEAYMALATYVSKNYFDGNDQKTLLALREPRFMALKKIFDRAIEDGDGSLIDPYEFFTVLTS